MDGLVMTITASDSSSLVAVNIGHETDTDGAVEILSLPDLEPVKHLSVPVGVVAAFSPDGRLLAAGDGHGRTRLFDTPQSCGTCGRRSGCATRARSPAAR
jgi:hypothetical protein